MNNMLAILIDPMRFTELPYFHREIEAVLNHVKASPPSSPDRPVMTAGEPEQHARRQRMAEGVPVDVVTWNGILESASTLSIELPPVAAG